MWSRPISSTPRSIHPSSNFTPSCKTCGLYRMFVSMHSYVHARTHAWIHACILVSTDAHIQLSDHLNALCSYPICCREHVDLCRSATQGVRGVIRNHHDMHIHQKMHRVLVALYVTEHCFGIGALFLAGAVAVPMSVPMAVPIMQCVCVHISAVCPSVCLCVCTACM